MILRLLDYFYPTTILLYSKYSEGVLCNTLHQPSNLERTLLCFVIKTLIYIPKILLWVNPLNKVFFVQNRGMKNPSTFIACRGFYHDN
jgi:hypothetical protein